jgi:hypothetical protein
MAWQDRLSCQKQKQTVRDGAGSNVLHFENPYTFNADRARVETFRRERRRTATKEAGWE